MDMELNVSTQQEIPTRNISRTPSKKMDVEKVSKPTFTNKSKEKVLRTDMEPQL